jgi:hypothetical protein
MMWQRGFNLSDLNVMWQRDFFYIAADASRYPARHGRVGPRHLLLL